MTLLNKVLWVSLLAVGSCYRPQIPNAGFRCDEGGRCPSGFVCSKGLCLDPAGSVSPGNEDGGVASEDLAKVPDGGGDLRESMTQDGGMDLLDPADMKATGPCVKGGSQVDKDVWACTGTFGAGKAAELCGSGYGICSTGGGIKDPEAACSLLGGFFATSALISIDFLQNGSVDKVYCGALTGRTRVVLGCGPTALPRIPAGMACQNLRTQVPCGENGLTGWTCANGLGDAQNSVPQNGVLCCKL